MASCTICTLDPCPHLVASGGTAGSIAGVKYAPSTKPACAACGRVHRNIGVDSYVVCAWRTYSKAKGEDCLDVTGPNAEEFGRWIASGGWARPAKKARGKAAVTAGAGVSTPAPVAAPAPSSPSSPGAPPTPTVPSFSKPVTPRPEDRPAPAPEKELADALAAI